MSEQGSFPGQPFVWPDTHRAASAGNASAGWIGQTQGFAPQTQGFPPTQSPDTPQNALQLQQPPIWVPGRNAPGNAPWGVPEAHEGASAASSAPLIAPSPSPGLWVPPVPQVALAPPSLQTPAAPLAPSEVLPAEAQQPYVPVFGIAPDVGALPTQFLRDTDEQWALWLGRGAVIGAKQGECIRPAEFLPDADAASMSNVDKMHGAMFDIDEAAAIASLVAAAAAAGNDNDAGRFYEIWRRLEWCRFVIFTTYNHRRHAPRYRLIVPFARPVDPGDYRYFWNEINGLLQGIGAEGQWNVDRLGYGFRVPTVEAQAEATCAYNWAPVERRLDPYRRFGNPPQRDSIFDLSRHYVRVEVSEPDKSDWIDDDEAFQKARRYFNRVGPGIVPGNRHHELLKVSCKLFWDFWLDWDRVHMILQEVNNRFPQPHSAHEVLVRVEMGFSRTRGSSSSSAVQQLNPDGTPKEPGCMRLKPPGLTDGQLEQLARAERKSNDGTRREIGGYLLNIRRNQHGLYTPIAPADTRVQATKLCANFLGEKYPNHDAEKIANLFAGSLAVSNSQEPGGPTVEDVKRWVILSQERKKQVLDKQHAEAVEKRQRDIKQAFGTGRVEEYTQEELEKLAAEAKCTVEELMQRLVIVLGASHYIYVNGDYRPPVSKDNFVNRAVVDLSPVPDVQLTRVTRDGEVKLRERQDIIARYGTVAHEGVVDLSAPRSYYDAQKRLFVEAPCRLREDLEPERVQVVEDWINTFSDASKVKDWLSYVTNTGTEPLPALYFWGARNSGKTLFAFAVSRLYSDLRYFTPLESYYQGFNDAVMRSPILVSDELLPDALQGKRGSERFRELIQSQTRMLSRKFLASVPMRGYLRVILLANNDNMLPGGGDFMTEADVAATNERILVIDMKKGPSQFLKRLTKKQRDDIIDKDQLAKYALYLRDTRPERNNERFPVEGGGIAAGANRFEYSGTRGKVLNWIYLALTGQGVIPLDNILPIFWDKSAESRESFLHVGVSAGLIFKNWALITDDQPKRPDMHDIADALRTISFPDKSRRIKHEGTQAPWRIVKTSHIEGWASRVDGGKDIVVESLFALLNKRRAEDKGIFAFDSQEQDNDA